MNVTYGPGIDRVRTSAGQYLTRIRAAECVSGIPTDLLTRMLYTESRFREDVISGQKRSPTGAIGIAQVLPSTARDPGYGVPPLQDPTNPSTAIPWAAAYLRAMYDRTKCWAKALGAYNQGLGAVLRASKAGGDDWLEHMPDEGRNYVVGIIADVVVS
jgi:soluble lytic murein transglycosylase-like protein